MAFEPGDVVMLKSGGHSMTVVAIEAEEIDCLWVGDDGQMFRQSIPSVALAAVESLDLDDSEDKENEEGSDDDEDDDDEEEGRRKRAKRR